MVVVTHNRSLAARADRVLLLDWRTVVSGMCANFRRWWPDALRQLPGARRGRPDQIENSAVTQLHLCEQCAAERGVETSVATPKHPLGEFLQAVQQQSVPASTDAGKCPFCGLDDAGLPRDRAGWGARGATTRSSRACASCSAACTAARATPAALRAAADETCSSARLGELRERLRRAIETGAVRAGGRAARPDPGAGMTLDLSLLPDGGVGWLDASGPRRRRALHADPAGAERRGLRVHRPGARRRAAPRARAGARGGVAVRCPGLQRPC